MVQPKLELPSVDEAMLGRIALIEQARRAMRSSFSAFFHAYSPSKPYMYGSHTDRLLQELQSATEALERGENTYLCFCLPPRHGKSDIVSRRYPVWHLLRNPDHEFILASYNYQLATEMAYEDRKLFGEIASMFGLYIQQGKSSVDAWGIADHKGAMYSAGIGGTITGRGAAVLGIDDYLKNRMEAESITVRDNIWRSFQSDMMTRLAPTHAVVIVANRWHEDDLVGRIINSNNPDHEKYDPEFPKFKIISCMAEPQPDTWLFPQRYDDKWYRTMRAAVGTYAWQSQFQQDPKPRTGNMLRADRVHIIEESELPEGLRFRRGWDLASTARERMKDSPDYTVGTKAAWHAPKRSIFITDVARGQWDAPERDKEILNCAAYDGPTVHARFETVAGYKDTFTWMRKLLLGKAVVEQVVVQRDKVARASIFEPIFEAGNVYIVRGSWNGQWISEFTGFPSGVKDDQVDSLGIAITNDILEKAGELKVSFL